MPQEQQPSGIGNGENHMLEKTKLQPHQQKQKLTRSEKIH
jgi:hypothetical protein